MNPPIIGCGHVEDHTDLIRCDKCRLCEDSQGCANFRYATERQQFTEHEEWERAKYRPLLRHYESRPELVQLDQFYGGDRDGGAKFGAPVNAREEATA